MAHVTFVHGIANKPEAAKLHEIWLRRLAQGGLNLQDEGVTTRLVYWADVLYAEPDPDVASHESTADDQITEAMSGPLTPAPQTPEERTFLEGLRSQMTAATPGSAPQGGAPEQDTAMLMPLERFPIPWVVKERFLDTYLRDVHHYMFDVSFSPRAGETYRVQQEIRRRFIEAMSDPRITAPHIVISHSMGTVIAYDCLKRVGDCAPVDGLITMGSPLGIDEVQDKLRPEWRRHDGFPSAILRGDWINVADRLDVVCGLDPRLANDYRRAGETVVEDHFVSNNGWWRHDLTQYLRQPTLQAALRRLLKI